MRILIVEDESDVRETLVEALRNQGHDVYGADSEERGLELLSEVQPKVILLDLLLHGSVVTDFIDAARQIAKGPKPRIIILSALVGAIHIAEAHQTEFLSKPFDVDRLFAMIEGKEKGSGTEVPKPFER